MNWTIEINRTATKQIAKLPKGIQRLTYLLLKDLELNGPTTGGSWKNYSKLKGMGSHDIRHCHLHHGKPTYVCCWEVNDKTLRVIEVFYVGTHEKAPY